MMKGTPRSGFAISRGRKEEKEDSNIIRKTPKARHAAFLIIF